MLRHGHEPGGYQTPSGRVSQDSRSRSRSSPVAHPRDDGRAVGPADWPLHEPRHPTEQLPLRERAASGTPHRREHPRNGGTALGYDDLAFRLHAPQPLAGLVMQFLDGDGLHGPSKVSLETLQVKRGHHAGHLPLPGRCVLVEPTEDESRCLNSTLDTSGKSPAQLSSTVGSTAAALPWWSSWRTPRAPRAPRCTGW